LRLASLTLLGLTILPLSAAGVDNDSIHQDLVTLDSHIDIPDNLGLRDADPGVVSPMQVDLPKMRTGGLDGGFFIVYTRQGGLNAAGYDKAYLAAITKFEAIDRMLSSYSDEIALAASPAAFEKNLAAGKLSAMIGIENGYSLGPQLEYLKEFAARHTAYISLTHFGDNQLATSSSPNADTDQGLSPVGKRFVKEMNRFGIMIDVSHASRQSTLEAAALSNAPIIASHSGAFAVHPHPRNLSDKEIRAIATNGGVIQLVAYDSYMREINEDNQQAIKQLMVESGVDGPDWFRRNNQQTIYNLREQGKSLASRWPRASLDTLINHIDHVVALVGIDHAGLASDFGGGGGVSGWDSADQSAAVTEALLERGYSVPDIQKIWSGNLLRVWNEVINAQTERPVQ
jgi:membrane dipeptidase